MGVSITPIALRIGYAGLEFVRIHPFLPIRTPQPPCPALNRSRKRTCPSGSTKSATPDQRAVRAWRTPDHRELAQEMGVSITPVREPSSGSSASRAWRCSATAVYVPYVNSEKLREIQQIRFHLEGMGAAEAAKHITRKQLDNLIALQQEFLSYRPATQAGQLPEPQVPFRHPRGQQQAHPAQHGGIVLGHHRPHPEGLPRQDGRHRLHQDEHRHRAVLAALERATPRPPPAPSRPTWSGAARS